MRAVIALYACGLLLYPVWGLLSPDDYRASLDEFPQAIAATGEQLQLVLLLFQVLAQVAMSPDPEDLQLKIRIRSELLLYSMLGLSLIGIARILKAKGTQDTPA